MLRFTKGQQAQLEVVGFERWIEEVRVHLQGHFPRLYGLRGPDKTRVWIRYGVVHAARYGVVADRDVRRFIHILYARGVGFEDRDEHSWIREILDNDERTGRWKMDRIQEGLGADGSEH